MKSKVLLMIGIIFFVSAGCATTNEPIHVVDVRAYLTPQDISGQGYGSTDIVAFFEDESVRIEVRQISAGDKALTNDILNRLYSKKLIILRMKITNKGDHQIIYNPGGTGLILGKLDYKKPMDYSDFYLLEEARKGHDDNASRIKTQQDLSKLRGLYYDLSTRVAEKESVDKLLLFSPPMEQSDYALLMIKEFYIGTKTINLTFAFDAVLQ
ncbi:MAG: hypothetical protein KAR06_10815 [Deltaproteobacteria bacterium]|nr:hypothetical protein [Deltaproteobacteria bacterium]